MRTPLGALFRLSAILTVGVVARLAVAAEEDITLAQPEE